MSGIARPFTVRTAGDHAVLIELQSNTEVHRFAAAARDQLGEVVEDVVPGHTTVLVSAHAGVPPLNELERIFNELSDDQIGSPAREIEIPVIYDGPDLKEISELTGLSIEAVCELHQARTYTVAFMGFSPGFAYLLETDPRLRLPRRQTPRVKVPGGAVAIAGEYSAVYPSDGPGGWHIVGHTNAILFDLSRDDPFLVEPGTRVRFEALS